MKINQERVFQFIVNGTPRSVILFDYKTILELIDTSSSKIERQKLRTQYLEFILKDNL